MGITQIAVMPLQALVDFFAPRHVGATKDVAAHAGIFWARGQLSAENREPTPARIAALPAPGARKPRVCERPWASSTPSAVTRVTRAGFAVQTAARTEVAPLSATDLSVRLRRAPEASFSSQLAGRMVISGRMRDVCAALERLAG